MWALLDITEIVAEAVRQEATRLDAEQSIQGIDAMDELRLHALFRLALSEAGFGVHPEQRYPVDRSRPRRSEGERCDLVLTLNPKDHLLDPLAAGTLFCDRGVQPDEALWIEVKVAGQFAVIEGVGRANAGYAGKLLTEAVKDVRKLARAAALRHAAVLLVIFNQDEETARHDLGAWVNRCIDRSLPLQMPVVRRFTINDRIGNGVCTIAMVPVETQVRETRSDNFPSASE